MKRNETSLKTGFTKVTLTGRQERICTRTKVKVAQRSDAVEGGSVGEEDETISLHTSSER